MEDKYKKAQEEMEMLKDHLGKCIASVSHLYRSRSILYSTKALEQRACPSTVDSRIIFRFIIAVV